VERILLAAPRGFCAGVAFAIEVVELALKVHGAPLYVRHAIVQSYFLPTAFPRRYATPLGLVISASLTLRAP